LDKYTAKNLPGQSDSCFPFITGVSKTRLILCMPDHTLGGMRLEEKSIYFGKRVADELDLRPIPPRVFEIPYRVLSKRIKTPFRFFLDEPRICVRQI